MRVSPCKDCSERHLGCHDRCPKYQDWRKEVTEGRRKIQQDNLVDFSPYSERRNRKWKKKGI